MLLERMFEKRSGSSDHEDGFNNILLNMFGGRKTASGERVSESNSLVQPDIFACVNVLSDDIAKLPIHTYKRTDGGIERKPEHMSAHAVYARPNPYMTAFTWKKLMMTHVLTWGMHIPIFNSDHMVTRKRFSPYALIIRMLTFIQQQACCGIKLC